MAIAMFDRQMRYLAVSRLWQAEFGMGTQDLVGRFDYEILPNLPEHMRSAHRGAIAGVIERREEDRFVRDDGAVRWLRWEVQPWRLPDGIIGGSIIFSEDITERKAAELQLARQAQMLDLAPALVRDLESRIILWNTGAEGMYGWTKDEVQGKISHELLQTDFPVPLERITATLLEAGQWRGELQHRKKDGSRLSVISHWIVHRGADGAAAAVIEVNNDITETKQVQEKLRSAIVEKEVLLKEVHHRVKNNLQIITSLLNLQGAVAQDPVILSTLQDSRARVRAMALIHEKLYQSPNLDEVDFHEYTQSLVSFLVRAHTSAQARVELRTQIEAVSIRLDLAIPCGLILNELVSNVLKHAFPDGRQGILEVRLRLDHRGHAQLQVRDNGVGFPPHIDFRRTESLGLQLVTDLVEQLGGTIELQNGAGSTFLITFPLLK
jgi:PAS domain S-box-containing protein